MNDNIVDLTERRNAAERPDPEHISHDDYGRPLYRFLLEYEMDGKSWGGVDVWAYSFDDAENRVKAMRESLMVRGQCYSDGPA